MASAEGDRVTTVELFFDLAYVFGFTQVSRLMADEHSPIAIVQGLAILALLWWSWTAYSWLSNQAHADEGVVRSAMFVGMTAVFVVALVIPEAYHDRSGGLSGPLVFVAAYLVARFTHLAVYVMASVGDTAARREGRKDCGVGIDNGRCTCEDPAGGVRPHPDHSDRDGHGLP
ncbi:low temperature requirement protein A [Nocardia sp. NPDC051990]|uniref:low temperature requirement protein A n=1 Tax=Nocardia sp. NPDC051990 TaxID=3155285 RepID=UPI0034383D7A